jgi:hypothetical protein
MNKEQKNLVLAAFSTAIFHKDGSVSVKRPFFYRHGFSSERFKSRILEVFPNAEIVESYEKYQNWPKESYWLVRFKLRAENVEKSL